MNQAQAIKTAAFFAALFCCGAAQADWSYDDSVDAMTSKRTSLATVRSNNSLNLDFPYKGTNHGRLMVRRHPQHGVDVIFIVDKGQIICSNYRGCEITARFDEQNPIKFNAVEPADNSSNTLFLKDHNRFISLASKAKRILVQVNMYQNGLSILEFTSAQPLAWPPKK